MQTSTASKKEQLRVAAKEWRSHMTHHDVQRVSRAASERLEVLLDWSTVRTLHTYSAIAEQNEIDPQAFLHWLWSEHPHVSVFTGIDDVYEVTAQTTFKSGAYNVPLPVGKSPVVLPLIDVALVPCLLASPLGQRIGYGKGHMDVFLSSAQPRHTIGMCYRQNTRDDLPQEEHDILLDAVVII